MFTSSAFRFFIFLLISAHLSKAQYVPPEALVEPLKPVGLRISIPDEPGISLVAFHVKFNQEFNGLEAGTIARDIVKPKNGRWTYEDKSTRLKENDIVYYWVHVVYNRLGYNLLDQEHRVTDFFDYEGQAIPQTGNKNGGFKPQSCDYSTTKLFDKTGASKNPCAGQLLFKEDFRDKAQLRRSQWTIVEQYPGSPDYEFVVYRDSPENIKVENGLSITPKLLRNEFGDNFIRQGSLALINCTGRFLTAECYSKARGWNVLPPVTSGRINTKNSINLEFGRIEIRAKLPRGEWIYPLLLLEPARNMPGSSLEAVQIRIASSAGNPELRLKDGSDIGGHLLWGGITGLNQQNPANQNQYRAMIYKEELWSDNFHVYELIWSPGRIVLKVDGQVYGDKRVNLPRDTPFYLTLGVAAGGRSEFPDYSVSRGFAKSWRNVEAKAMYHFYETTDIWSGTWQNGATSLNVDYVKIWAL